MEVNEFGFYRGFDPEDGISPELDALIVSLGRIQKEMDARPAIINQKEVKKLMLTYEFMKRIIKSIEGVEVFFGFNTSFSLSGHVSVVAERLEFLRPEWFMKAYKLVGNVDVYPKTDGTVCLDFSFNNLATIIRE